MDSGIEDLVNELEVGTIIDNKHVEINSIQHKGNEFIVRSEEFQLSGNKETKLYIGVKTTNTGFVDAIEYDSPTLEQYDQYVNGKKKPLPILVFGNEAEYIKNVKVTNALLSDIGRKFEGIPPDDWIDKMKGDEQVIEFSIHLPSLIKKLKYLNNTN